MKQVKDIKVIRCKGRFGTVHYAIKEMNKGNYQNINNKTFDSYEDAIDWAIDNLVLNKGGNICYCLWLSCSVRD